MRKFSIAVGLLAMLAAPLAGCVTTDSTIATPSQMYIGVNAYVAAGDSAAIYLKSPACTAKPPQALCQSVYSAMLAARAAKTQIIAALKANQTAPLTALQTMEAAYAIIQNIPKQ